MDEFNLDPIRQVRAAKRWAFAGILCSVFALLVLYNLLLDLAAGDILVVLIPAAAFSAAAIELAARWEARTHRRYAYPHRLGYELAAIHDFSEACRTSAERIRVWLDLDATVIAWLSEDGDTLTPVAASGLTAAWINTAARIPAARCGLRCQSAPGVFSSTAMEDPWFRDAYPEDRVVFVPLVSRHSVAGVLCFAARRRNPQIGDQRLLAALGMVLGLALDNCKLYEGQRANAQHFQELHRMKTDFLTTVSHELRTPLTSIMMAAEMLLEEEETRDPDSTRGKLVRNIVKGASRLSTLVNDLVTISREDDFQPRLELEAVPLADAVSNAVSIVQPLFSAKKQTIEVDIENPRALVRIDRLRFEQVLINLLSNAQRYTPPGGHVALCTRRLASGETLVAVSDSGPGVTPEDADRIFEPFYRGDRSGLGLGLAIARSIVGLHNGRIWVEPAECGGSRFCVALPAEAARRVPAAPDRDEQPRVNKITSPARR
jgi:signal transduction histidine kinase